MFDTQVWLPQLGEASEDGAMIGTHVQWQQEQVKCLNLPTVLASRWPSPYNKLSRTVTVLSWVGSHFWFSHLRKQKLRVVSFSAKDHNILWDFQLGTQNPIFTRLSCSSLGLHDFVLLYLFLFYLLRLYLFLFIPTIFLRTSKNICLWLLPE